jgi:hypothetical protein
VDVFPDYAGRSVLRLGAVLAYLGHAGTIAFFSWWLLTSLREDTAATVLDTIAPIDWGVMFELVLVVRGCGSSLLSAAGSRGREAFFRSAR